MPPSQEQRIMVCQISTVPDHSMKRLGFKYALHLKAAECWLALGKIEEARHEMSKITRKHPAVAQVQRRIETEIRCVQRLISDDAILTPYWYCEAESR